MPLRLKLFYLLSCLIDTGAYTLNPGSPNYFCVLPVLCLLAFYYSARRKDLKLKDYTYGLGLLFAAIADIFFEFENEYIKSTALLFYSLSYSFYISTVRHEAVFGTTWKDLQKIALSIALISAPVLIVSPVLGSAFFFSSILYMTFLALLIITALMRKASNSSYYWFLAGSIFFSILTMSEIYFLYVSPTGLHVYFQILFYVMAQFSIFQGVTKTFRNFYEPELK
ncbi:hypothetical protein [Emticicia fluvialis]|uniref:hypothetical protein n=1 Tax=Emticicia fluvialis TaxID=2974474 RepID=UPI0021657AFB|nr:hypothetical protein [Emticicia fluvialis]